MENLTNLSGVLQRTTISRHLSPSLRGSLQTLKSNADDVSSSILKDFKEQSSSLSKNAANVARATCQSDVAVAQLTTCLATARQTFTRDNDAVRGLMTKTHTEIGSCREEMKNKEQTEKEKKISQDKNEKEIKLLESQISNYEREAEEKEREAERLKKEAKEKENQRDVHIGLAIVGTGVLGLLTLATGGAAAAAYGAATVANAAINTGGAISCQDRINTLEREAREKRALAEEARRSLRRHKETKYGLEKEIKALKEDIAELKETVKALTEVDGYLCRSINESDEFIRNVQALCDVLDEAKNKTDMIKLIQNIIANKPVVGEKMDVQTKMNKFKSSWEAVESKMSQSMGRRRISD